MKDINASIKLKDNKKNLKPKPFIKWAGGKRGIIEELLRRLPNKINDYYEPFVGGGALFYQIFDKARYSYLSDSNEDLVIAYQVIKNNPKQLIDLLKQHNERHNNNYYYEIRNMNCACLSKESTIRAARTIYLLKTCFNGLYRVNNKGCFNTPIGSYKNPNIVDEKNIMFVSNALERSNIKCCDFSEIKPKDGDFVYFDPPYHPIKKTSFVRYVDKGFNEKDQKRLRDFALFLKNNAVNVMISNSNAQFIHELYRDNFKIEIIWAPRAISCNSKERTPVSEVLITSYDY